MLRSSESSSLRDGVPGAVVVGISHYADGFISPWIGANFAQEVGDGRTAFGFTRRRHGGGVFGGEFDFGYSPSFFGTDSTFGVQQRDDHDGESSFSASRSAASAGGGVRPYGSGGVGLIRSSAEGLSDVTRCLRTTALGWNPRRRRDGLLQGSLRHPRRPALLQDHWARRVAPGSLRGRQRDRFLAGVLRGSYSDDVHGV